MCPVIFFNKLKKRQTLLVREKLRPSLGSISKVDFKALFPSLTPTYCNTGVGKVRPAGIIRHAKVFCMARWKIFQNNQLVFHVRMKFSVHGFSKVWLEGPKKNYYAPTRGPKYLPTPVVTY